MTPNHNSSFNTPLGSGRLGFICFIGAMAVNILRSIKLRNRRQIINEYNQLIVPHTISPVNQAVIDANLEQIAAYTQQLTNPMSSQQAAAIQAQIISLLDANRILEQNPTAVIPNILQHEGRVFWGMPVDTFQAFIFGVMVLSAAYLTKTKYDKFKATKIYKKFKLARAIEFDRKLTGKEPPSLKDDELQKYYTGRDPRSMTDEGFELWLKAHQFDSEPFPGFRRFVRTWEPAGNFIASITMTVAFLRFMFDSREDH